MTNDRRYDLQSSVGGGITMERAVYPDVALLDGDQLRALSARITESTRNSSHRDDVGYAGGHYSPLSLDD